MLRFLILNFLILIVPLALSFDKKIQFYKKIFSYIFSASIVSTLFVIFEVVATKRSDLIFYANKSLGLKFINIPLEEVLLLFIIPYSVTFLYESLKYYFKSKKFNVPINFRFVLSIIFFIISFFFVKHSITFIYILLVSVSFYLHSIFKKELMNTGHFWATIAFAIIPYLLINYLLVSSGILILNPLETTGYALFNIPMEMYFSSFALISLWLLFFEIGKSIFK